MQRHKNFGTWTYVLLTLFTFALKMAIFNCEVDLWDDNQAKLTAALTDIVVLKYDRVMSPTLLQYSLLVAVLGSKNGSDTQKELQRASQVSGSKDELAERLRKLSKAVNLKSYLFVNERLRLKTAFSTRTEFVDTESAKFSDTEEVATNINAFVAKQTKNQLQKDKQIVKERNIDIDTNMIELNLINFSAKWKIPFIKISENGNRKLLMSTHGKFLFGRVEELQATAVVLPFEGKKNIKMLLIFADKLVPLQKRLKKVDVTKIPSVLNYTETELSVPSFTIQTVNSLFPGTLRKMKIKEALSGGARFDNFFKKNTQSFLSNFDQFSSIRVDMNGVHFASATNAQYELTSAYASRKMLADPEFDEDVDGKNPFFYYLIKDRNVLAAGSSYNKKR